jgi:hypothetical protein
MLFSIGATEDAASGRAARPDGTAAFRQTLLVPTTFLLAEVRRPGTACDAEWVAPRFLEDTT